MKPIRVRDTERECVFELRDSQIVEVYPLEGGAYWATRAQIRKALLAGDRQFVYKVKGSTCGHTARAITSDGFLYLGCLEFGPTAARKIRRWARED